MGYSRMKHRITEAEWLTATDEHSLDIYRTPTDAHSEVAAIQCRVLPKGHVLVSDSRLETRSSSLRNSSQMSLVDLGGS